jgi:hypothetical protein
MTDTLAPLVLDFIEWVARTPRPYADVMEAWRTSCPLLAVWEDALDSGPVRQRRDGRDLAVVVTERGRDLLRAAGRDRAQPVA